MSRIASSGGEATEPASSTREQTAKAEEAEKAAWEAWGEAERVVSEAVEEAEDAAWEVVEEAVEASARAGVAAQLAKKAWEATALAAAGRRAAAWWSRSKKGA